jgi:hypothetical protein
LAETKNTSFSISIFLFCHPDIARKIKHIFWGSVKEFFEMGFKALANPVMALIPWDKEGLCGAEHSVTPGV